MYFFNSFLSRLQLLLVCIQCTVIMDARNVLNRAGSQGYIIIRATTMEILVEKYFKFLRLNGFNSTIRFKYVK